MTQSSSTITSTQQRRPSTDVAVTQTGGRVLAVLGGITLLASGIFLILAAHSILPNGINAISNLGVGGYILGYGTLVVGSFVAVYGLWKAFSQKELHKSAVSTKAKKDVEDNQGSVWENQIRKAAEIDVVSGMTGWKQGAGRNGIKQTFAAFEASEARKKNAQRNVLKIIVLDQGISEKEQQSLGIVSDYLAAVHGVTVSVTTDCILTGDKSRSHYPDGSQCQYHLQYAAEPNIDQLKVNLPENAFVIGFTSGDLYPYDDRNSTNFIFGIGCWQYAAGLFSICRIRSWDSGTTLIRLMKLASHELGHMRGLTHCTEHLCCIQGVNNMVEADEAPLTFCALDMAKICCLNSWSLKEGYQRQLEFFEGFKKRYGRNISFSGEIQHLRKKIEILT